MSPHGSEPVRLDGVAATQRLAATLAARCQPGHLVALNGPLGVGKTTFVKAYAACLGVHGAVTSPTFTLVHRYRCGAGAPVSTLLHVDLWRIAHDGELVDLALDEELDAGAAAIVEWADRADVSSRHEGLDVTLSFLDGDAREAVVSTRRVRGISDVRSARSTTW